MDEEKTDPSILLPDREKTDPGFGTPGLFSIIGAAFNQKVTRVKDISAYLCELLDPAERSAAMWRLAVALKDMLEVGTDLHRVVTELVSEQPSAEVDPTDVTQP